MPLSFSQAVLSDDGVGIRLGEPDPPEEPLTLKASIPPHRIRLGSLRPHTPYHIRVACASSQGSSPWTHWLPMETPEGGKKELRRGRCCLLPHWTSLTSVPPPASPLTHSAHVASIPFPSSFPLSIAHWHLSRTLSLCFRSWEACTNCPRACPLHPAPTSWEQGRGSGRGGGASFPSSLSSSAPGTPRER